MDNIYKIRSRLINTITISLGIIEYIEGCALLELDKIVLSDY